MAYCVRCGVKLEPGSTECPLCKTKVIAPDDVVGSPQGAPLFPASGEDGRTVYQRLDKNRKGVIELVIAFMAIATITLVITSFALGASFSPWLPIGLVILGGSYILVAFFVQPIYTRIASWYVPITVVLLAIIDLNDLSLSWSVAAILSVVLYWFVAVVPSIFPKRRLKEAVATSVVAVAAYFPALDAAVSGALDWSLEIALPTYGVVLASLGFLVLRMYKGKPSVTDIVLSLILSACWGVVAGDFFHLRSIDARKLLSWSSSVFIVAVCLLVFLTLNVTLRRVRNYFNNRVV